MINKLTRKQFDNLLEVSCLVLGVLAIIGLPGPWGY